ncbi:MAG: hypothetical protein OXB93_02145 [Cytophagales bacterium]|nr:hypothetical protein [Cytophagales bacterium]
MSNKENKLTPLYEDLLTLKQTLEDISERVRVDRIVSYVAGLITGVSIGLFISLLIELLCKN